MKEKFYFSLLAIACFVCSISVNAEDFKENGIYYTTISETEATCAVVKGETDYEGVVDIPGMVNHGGKQFTVTQIGEKAFSNCSKLTKVSIPNSVLSIGNNAFLQCKALATVELQNGEFAIELGSNDGKKGLFTSTALETLHLGRNILYATDKAHGYSPFLDVRSLKKVTFAPSVTRIGRSQFCGCSSLDNIELPQSLTTIEDLAFQECSALSAIEVPALVTKVGDLAFQECSGMKTLVIGNGVKVIGGYAFANCSQLTTVTIGAGVDSIADEAFSGTTTNIATITSLNTIAAKTAIIDMRYVFTDDTYDKATLYVPKGAVQSYQTTYGWKHFKNIQEIQSTAVNNVHENGAKVMVVDEKIMISGTDEETVVTVYGIDGKLIYRGISDRVIQVPQKGVYVVKIGAKTCKVAL